MWKKRVKWWKTTGLLRSGCIHTPGPCAPAGRPTLDTAQKSAATPGQWWRLHVVLSLPHLARWGAPGFSLPAIWTKNWVLRSFTGPFSMDLNQDSEVLLSTSPNTPSRYKTEREELRHLHLPPGWPSLPLSPGPLGDFGDDCFYRNQSKPGRNYQWASSVCSVKWCFHLLYYRHL